MAFQACFFISCYYKNYSLGWNRSTESVIMIKKETNQKKIWMPVVGQSKGTITVPKGDVLLLQQFTIKMLIPPGHTASLTVKVIASLRCNYATLSEKTVVFSGNTVTITSTGYINIECLQHTSVSVLQYSRKL